jgi:molybdopterin-guanine dinucleotide biosynthesis protein A
MNCYEPSLDAGILSGGLGRRMGGLDKGLVRFRGRPMAAHVHDALQPSVERVWINCNRNSSSYREISPWLCHDAMPDFSGPLAGLLALLESSQAEYLIVAPCDTPLLSPSYAQQMRNGLLRILATEASPECPLVLAARCGERIQPLHLCLARTARGLVSTRLTQGKLKVLDWLHAAQSRFIDFPVNDPRFDNFNQPTHLDDPDGTTTPSA